MLQLLSLFVLPYLLRFPLLLLWGRLLWMGPGLVLHLHPLHHVLLPISHLQLLQKGEGRGSGLLNRDSLSQNKKAFKDRSHLLTLLKTLYSNLLAPSSFMLTLELRAPENICGLQ